MMTLLYPCTRSLRVLAAVAALAGAAVGLHAQCDPEFVPNPAVNAAPFELTNSLFINANVADTTEWAPSGPPQLPWLVAGGSFTKANGATANFVTAWDGAKPVGLGLGFDQQVYAVHNHNGILFAGGAFTSSGSNACSKIARWNPGTGQWIGVGGGVSPNSVFALESFDANHLAVGGEFGVLGTGAGAKTCLSGAALWNVATSTWTPLGAATDFFSVADLKMFQGSLYACGALNSAPSMKGVARWNGSAWVPLATGLDGPAFSMHVFNNELFLAGKFDGDNAASKLISHNFIRWNGSSFLKETFNVNSPTPYIMNDLIDDKGTMLAIGKIAPNVNSTYRRDPSGWQVTAQYFDQPAQTLGKFRGQTVVGGGFKELTVQAGQPKKALPGIARLVSATPAGAQAMWTTIDASFNGPVLAMLSNGDSMYLGGAFSIRDAAGDVASNIIATNGQQYGALKDLGGFTSVNGPVQALAFFSNSPVVPPALIIGGSFSIGAGMTVNNIIQWKIGVWSKLGEGFNAPVRAIRQYGNTLYAAGEFTASGATPISHLAKFTGGQWQPALNLAFNNIFALGIHANKLMIGGVNGVSGPLEGVTLFDGTLVTPIGVANAPVLALASFNGEAIAAGTFTTIGGTAVNRIARWDGVSWKAMGSGFSGVNAAVNALFVHDSQLYAGGVFSSSGATTLNNFARWNGTSWVDVDSGVDGPVHAMAVIAQKLAVGGGFVNAGGKSSPSWATLECSCYADCDASGQLGIDDFICFQTLFALGDPSADCDGSGHLGIDDFICFQTTFALGC